MPEDTEVEQTLQEALRAAIHNYGTWLALGMDKEKALNSQVEAVEHILVEHHAEVTDLLANDRKLPGNDANPPSSGGART